MKKCICYVSVLMILLHSLPANAKQGSISGKIYDNENKALAYANVILLKTMDSSLATSSYTDDNGRFNINAVTNGEYILKVLLMGYETYTSERFTITDNNFNIPLIKLRTTDKQLKEVSVRGQKPFIEVKPDMLVVNVENSIVSAGSSALEVLQRSPGVTVDQNDNISLKGKQGVNIMINGKIQPISSADLASMLKGMSSSAIEKIELISNPSAKYDAAGTAGIINIVLKKDQNMGFNGTATGGYGQGMYPKANAGFNLNYRNKNFNAYVNYTYAYRKGFNNLSMVRNFYDNDVNDFRYDEIHQSVIPFNDNNAVAGIDYNLSKHTTVGSSIMGNVNSYDFKGNVNTMALDPAVNEDQVDSTAITKNKSNNRWYNYAVNLNLKHDFDSSGKELTIDADYGRYWNRNFQDLTTNYFMNDSMMRIPYQLHGDVSGLTQIRSFKADYTNPLKGGGKIEAGIKTSFVTADNEPIFYDETGGQHLYDSTKSDHFIYNENINAAYINASKDFSKWAFQLGLRTEQTNINGIEKTTGQTINQSYVQLFPSFAVQNHIDANNDLGLTLSRRIDRPDYSQLNPYKLYTDPTTYVQGNPYLQPALTYSAELSHTYKQKFITTLNYSITNNVIAQVLDPSAGRVTIQTDQNIARMNYIGISCAYPFQILKWWSNITNLNAYYSQYIGNLDNTNLNNGQPTFDIYTNNTFILLKDMSAEAGLIYQAAQAYGFMHLQPQWWVNAGIQKNFFNKKLTIKINATDIFFTAYTKATSYYNGYTEYFSARRDMSQVNFVAIYHFGNKALGQIRHHSGGAEDEMKRAGSGGA